MKVAAWFVLSAIIQTVQSNKSNFIVHYAINAILNRDFERSKIDIVYYGSSESDNFVGKILKLKNESISIKVYYNKLNQSINILNTSSVVLMDSKSSFKKKVNIITWQSDPLIRNKHILYFPNAIISDLTDLNGFFLDNVAFLVNENEESIDLVTIFMFTPENCRSNRLEIINRFRQSNMRWESSNFYPNKYKNFHGCTLKVGVVDKRTTFASKDIGSMIKTLAQTANFIVNISIVDTMQNVLDSNNVDLIDSIEPTGFDATLISSPYYFGNFIILIPPGESYSPLEKMFMIFGFEVWLWIAVTFLIAFGTILVVNCASLKIQKFVFGRDVETPTLNVFSTFLIGNQNVMPGRNFARFLLMLFIIWSLIIRTCYQSELFKYLQQDLRKPEVKSIPELIERGFTLYDATGLATRLILSTLDEEFKKRYNRVG